MTKEPADNEPADNRDKRTPEVLEPWGFNPGPRGDSLHAHTASGFMTAGGACGQR